jgi:hypothetical protein
MGGNPIIRTSSQWSRRIAAMSARREPPRMGMTRWTRDDVRQTGGRRNGAEREASSDRRVTTTSRPSSVELPYEICVMCENVRYGQITVARDDDGLQTIDDRQRPVTRRPSTIVRRSATAFGCGLAALGPLVCFQINDSNSLTKVTTWPIMARHEVSNQVRRMNENRRRRWRAR